MEWRNSYLDLIFVPLGFLLPVVYHGWLWHKVRCQPHHTDIGINSAGRLVWVMAMMKENSKKDILVVQTVRNAIMGSTVMATASIFLTSGLAAIIGSTYNNNVNEPAISSAVYGGHGSIMVVLKFVTILFAFLCAFLFYSLSINSMNQVIFLINIPHEQGDDVQSQDQLLSREYYVCCLLEKGFLLQTVGSRFFYAGLPLLFWVFGPLLLFMCSLLMVSVLYNIDIVQARADQKATAGVLIGRIRRINMFDISAV